ncbi:Golgi-associated plant pathogenesis-related protein 1-like [Xenia sp. Carnegie-2017]|uniref:Golgi-associated plant pathogenesis-related protein 1-like n=1 Tax=Xenia sp. Carnegie-2017 TaxID=2897299 RepID=UPI001F04419F|nr:Golgi-associated plant pathogenesis-related protein 1-like [Xenia sp. Carnegie-2017]
MSRQLADKNTLIRDEILELNTSSNKLKKRSNVANYGTYGENTIKLSNVPYRCNYGVQEAIKRWYNEGRYFSFSSPQISKDTSPFTQVIWKKSKQLGIGCAERNGLLIHDLYVVALYNPAGNTLIEVRENVRKPGKVNNVYRDVY